MSETRAHNTPTLRHSMAANAKEVAISIDSPTNSLSGNGSAHTSLVSSYQGRHYGTVNKGQWKANGYILHTITSTDTLQGIALKYKVPVRFLLVFTIHPVPSVYPLSTCICPFINQFIHLSINSLIYQSIHSSINQFIHPSINSFIHFY